MTIRNLAGQTPEIAEGVYVDEQACVIGNVSIGRHSSIWPFSVIRGDVNTIRIGEYTNIQDNSTVHVTHDSHYHPGGFPTIIGNYVTVGHQVILHACRVGDRCLIGMGSVIMDNVQVGDDVILGAGSLVTQGNRLDSGFLYLGRPARRVRELDEDEKQRIVYSAKHYAKLKDRYLNDKG